MLIKTLPLLLFACGQDGDVSDGRTDRAGRPFPPGSGPMDEATAETAAVNLLGGGVVVDSDRDEDEGLELWEVYVRRPSGSIVEVEFEIATGDVHEVESESPVEGDDLILEPGFISLLEAIDLATTRRPGVVTAWELEREGRSRWEWEIRIRSGSDNETQVEIDAHTDEPDAGRSDDDDDDDGDDDDDDDDHGYDDDDDDDWWNGDDDDDDDDDDGRDLPEAVRLAIQEILPAGSIDDVDIDRYDDDDDDGDDGYFDIEVETPRGAEIDLEFDVSGQLLEADSDDAPIDYDVTPPGLISLMQALEAAGRTGPELSSWDLDDDRGFFTWDLDFEDRDIEVDAVSGELL